LRRRSLLLWLCLWCPRPRCGGGRTSARREWKIWNQRDSSSGNLKIACGLCAIGFGLL